MKAGYITKLTREERAGCMKLGAVMAFAQAGILPSQIDGLSKTAGVNDYLNTLGKAILTVSLVGGIPLGVAAHIVHRRINQQSEKEKEMQEQLKYYRAATGSLGQGLGEINQ